MIGFAWVLVVIFHLFFTAILSLQFFFYKKGDNQSQPSISIIIAARNEAENLKQLIPKLLDQQYSTFEIIIALDRCTDDSLSFLKSIESPQLRIVEITETPNEWNSKKFALNEAIKKSKNEWLLFTDADCIPATNLWVSSFARQIGDKANILIGYSPYQIRAGLLSKYIRFESFITGFLYLSSAISGRPYMAVGRNMAIRKAFFLSSYGYESFKHTQGGDDDLFIQRNANDENTKVVLSLEAIVETFPKASWKEYFNQKLRHLAIGSKYKLMHKVYLGIYHVSHFLMWMLLFFQSNFQLILVVVLFYLFIKLGSYRFAASKMGAGFNYILLPLVDILYAILTPMIACWSKLEKDIRWKN